MVISLWSFPWSRWLFCMITSTQIILKMLVLHRVTLIIEYSQKIKTNSKCHVLLSVLASLGLSHRFHLKPQATFSTKNKLWETADFSREGPEFWVVPWQQAEPKQSQGHNDSQLSQGKFLSNAVPERGRRCLSDLSYLKSSTIIKAVPGSWGKRDEGVRIQTVLVGGVKSQRIKVLRRRAHLGMMQIRNVPKEKNLKKSFLHVGLSRQQGCGVFHKYWPDRWHL